MPTLLLLLIMTTICSSLSCSCFWSCFVAFKGCCHIHSFIHSLCPRTKSARIALLLQLFCRSVSFQQHLLASTFNNIIGNCQTAVTTRRTVCDCRTYWLLVKRTELNCEMWQPCSEHITFCCLSMSKSICCHSFLCRRKKNAQQSCHALSPAVC